MIPIYPSREGPYFTPNWVPILKLFLYVENQSLIHRLDKEARHVGEDEDKEDRSQHEQESLGEKMISRIKYLSILFPPFSRPHS